jgi:DNA-binding CsgD family transcriptional regulator
VLRRTGAIDLGLVEQASARIGESVIDPAVWPDLLENLYPAFGASGALLLQSDVRTPDVPRTASINEGVNTYFRDNWHIHESRAKRGIPLLLQGTPVVIDQDLFTPEEIANDPFYNELLIPYGMPWFGAVGFRAGDALWALVIQRGPRDGLFHPADKRILASLSARLTEAATLSTALGRAALSGATTALSVSRRAAIAIDRHGRVLDQSPLAEGLFDDDLFVKNGRLQIRDKEAQRQFDGLLLRLLITPDTGALPTEPIMIRRGKGHPMVLGILPVPAAARSPFLGARAVLTFTSLEPRRGPTVGRLIQSFRLTPAEARLASIVAEGISPDEAAERLGVSRETVRNQLKSIFAKTNTRRQAELAALLAVL